MDSPNENSSVSAPIFIDLSPGIKNLNITILYYDLPLHLDGFITNSFDKHYIVINKRDKNTLKERYLCIKAITNIMLNKNKAVPVFFFDQKNDTKKTFNEKYNVAKVNA